MCMKACHAVFFYDVYKFACASVANSSPIERARIQIGKSIASFLVSISKTCLESNLNCDLCSHQYAYLIQYSSISKGLDLWKHVCCVCDFVYTYTHTYFSVYTSASSLWSELSLVSEVTFLVIAHDTQLPLERRLCDSWYLPVGWFISWIIWKVGFECFC